ncbi:MAG TPA: kynureninase [Phycisphaerales bacterium]|nr:kynureninase [Phycisphaerales bacterium]
MTDLDRAKDLDAHDPLRSCRSLFEIPRIGGREVVYLTGNSLGLQPKEVRSLIEQELDDWATLGVNAHFEGRDPWKDYHEQFREPLARLVGAEPNEVVAMNSLTVNLHLLMVSFYRPTKDRHVIVIEDNAFPSDSYAVESQIRFHGYPVGDSLVRLKPRPGEQTLRTADILAELDRLGERVALVLLGGVNYLTGQVLDIPRITAAAHRHGSMVGWDLAHAAGNVPLQLHDWGADFAAWCSYKYLNAGPGAIAGAFVHRRHHDADLPRLAGWWSTDPDTRFEMRQEFEPQHSVDAWQISNPPILAMTPLKASLAIFDAVGMDTIRRKSVALTTYMRDLLLARCADRVSILTPSDPAEHGAQLSLVVRGASRLLRDRLEEHGVIADFREPNVIRVAPVPLYVTYSDVWRFVDTLANLLENRD